MVVVQMEAALVRVMVVVGVGVVVGERRVVEEGFEGMCVCVVVLREGVRVEIVMWWMGVYVAWGGLVYYLRIDGMVDRDGVV